MIVEDEAVIRQGIRNILEDITMHEIVITEFDNVPDAWAYLKKDIPNLVITDIRMREMDGLTLIRKLRQLYAELPVIIISGHQDFEYAQQAIRYKVTDYLLKPIDRRELLQLVMKIADQLVPSTQDAADPTAPGGDEDSLRKGDNRRMIRKLMEYIDTNPDGDLRLQVLAEYCGIHATYLSQLFKAETNCNLSDYITQARLNRAKQLLATTNLKIYDVAHLSGYQSPKHFMLVFKQHLGMTPSEYREHSI